MNDLFASIGVMFVLAVAMGVVKTLEKHLSKELSRKIIHMTMGIVSLTFPQVFENKLSVLMLGGFAAAALSALRLNKTLRSGFGSPLLGIARKSFGEIYFAVSIAVVYVLHDNIAEYVIPISVLTFADSTAALVGTSYGRLNMARGHEDAKSGEGSVMFFIVAFICSLVPLQLMTEVGRAEVLLISFLIGLLAAMIEAVSANGIDNLLLPMLVYSFVKYNMNLSVHELCVNFAVMVFFLVVILVVYNLTELSRLSVAYSLLVGYILMIQGGLLWIIPALLLFVTFGILPMANEKERGFQLTYRIIECNSIIGVICLWLSTVYPAFDRFFYTGEAFSFTSLLLINTYCRLKNYHTDNRRSAATAAFIKAVVFLFFPTAIIKHYYFGGVDMFVIAAFSVMLGVSVYTAIWLNREFGVDPGDPKTALAWELAVGAMTAALIFLEVGYYYLFKA